MSLQEIRQNIIHENIKKLIESLTSFTAMDENFVLCEQFAMSSIRNHRYLTVNSHELKRRLDGLCVRFQIANNKVYSDKLIELYTYLINDPICVEHYETDLHWSILNLLLDLSYNPVNAVKNNLNLFNENKNLLATDPYNNDSNNINQEIISKEYWVKLLEQDNFTNVKGLQNENSDTDLSDWSDIENDDDNYQNKILNNENKNNVNNNINDSNDDKNIEVNKSQIQPPQKLQIYKLFDSSNSHKWLSENIHNSWWIQNNICDINSNHEGANFCLLWNKNLAIASNNLIKFRNISTVSECCLIREIIWMFMKPLNCKFFHINDKKIELNKNVSLPSVTLNGIQLFLEKFTYYMTLMLQLKEFCTTVTEPIDANPPFSYECYAKGLQELLNPMILFLLDQENESIKNGKFGIDLTIIKLYNELTSYFTILENIYDIHTFSILDFTKNHSHICTAHLMAGLLTKSKIATSVIQSNLASSLFLITIKVYLQIIDIWWTDGHLDDWRNEFLISKNYADSMNMEYNLRLITKCKEQSFYVDPAISKLIETNTFIKLIKDHSLQAGYALNILMSLDRIHEMKIQCGYQENIYTTFLNSTLNNLLEFSNNSQSQLSTNGMSQKSNNIKIENGNEILKNLKEFRNLLNAGDEILAMTFEESLEIIEKSDNIQTNKTEITQSTAKKEWNTFSLFERLNQTTSQILPFEQIICKIISKLLQSRISVANHCVMKMYKDEYQVLQHLQNLRKVFLLEAGDIMYYFYSNLFQQIESNDGDSWANPYLLTVQLDGILCSRNPDMSSLFSIEITSSSCSKSKYILEAIDGIKINYLVDDSLSNVISEKNLKEYNDVFRFLLKVKWGLWTLENLKFTKSWKKRLPYVELTINDFLMKRLALLRNWILYSIQCIHSHLMTQILQSMAPQLDEKIKNSENLMEMIAVHNSFIKTIYDHCFQSDSYTTIRVGIDQLLNLISVVRFEWDNMCAIKESEEVDCSSITLPHADCTDNGNGDNSMMDTTSTSQIKEIENTYINCHCYLAGSLNTEVYSKNQQHLSGLSVAFNCSCPY